MNYIRTIIGICTVVFVMAISSYSVSADIAFAEFDKLTLWISGPGASKLQLNSLTSSKRATANGVVDDEEQEVFGILFEGYQDSRVALARNGGAFAKVGDHTATAGENNSSFSLILEDYLAEATEAGDSAEALGKASIDFELLEDADDNDKIFINYSFEGARVIAQGRGAEASLTFLFDGFGNAQDSATFRPGDTIALQSQTINLEGKSKGDLFSVGINPIARASIVPAPGALALLGTAGLVGRRRRRR